MSLSLSRFRHSLSKASLVLLVAVASITDLSAARERAVAPEHTIVGRLSILAIDGEDSARYEYYIQPATACEGAAASRVKLLLRDRAPWPALRPGMLLRASGSPADDGALLVSDLEEIPAGPEAEREQRATVGGGITAESLQARPESLLVMIGHFIGTAPPCSTATAQQFAYADPNHRDVRDYYLATSHGGISQFTATVMDDVLLPYAWGSGCRSEDWANFLDDQARAHKVNPDNYSRTMYVIPNNGCGPYLGGFAWIGGKRSFVFGCSLGLMGHELGHSLGMDHANSLGAEYGDSYDIMTRGVPDTVIHEVNAPHRLQLNWIPTERVVNVPLSGFYTLGALERDGLSTPQILRIRRSNLNEDYIYLSYRETFGQFDANIVPAGATHVYRWDGGPTDLRQVLNDGDTFEESGIARVQQVSHTAGQATVRIDLGPSSPPPPPPPPPPSCTATATALCLQNSRFRVTATWSTGSSSGAANAVPFSNDTGLFWFFNQNNTELAVKVLDGTPVNGRFWVFYGGLTNLEYTIVVTDTSTGVTESYHNPSGGVCGGRDTDFGNPGAQTNGVPPDISSGTGTPTTCAQDAATLCLQPGGDTIKVQVNWRTADGRTGVGLGGLLPNTAQGGDFTFFSAGNVELLAKVLDGRPVNQRYWVFTGALTDVEYWITFTDTASGRWVTLHNPQGNYCGSANTDLLY